MSNSTWHEIYELEAYLRANERNWTPAKAQSIIDRLEALYRKVGATPPKRTTRDAETAP